MTRFPAWGVDENWDSSHMFFLLLVCPNGRRERFSFEWESDWVSVVVVVTASREDVDLERLGENFGFVFVRSKIHLAQSLVVVHGFETVVSAPAFCFGGNSDALLYAIAFSVSQRTQRIFSYRFVCFSTTQDRPGDRYSSDLENRMEQTVSLFGSLHLNLPYRIVFVRTPTWGL
jgi:hypothetical protein